MTQSSLGKGQTTRIPWIDFCRIYTVFIVVVRHDHGVGANPLSYLDIFHFEGMIFVFFLLSGYFSYKIRSCTSSKNPHVDFKRLFRLLVPYLFWVIVGVLALFPIIYHHQIASGDWSFLSIGNLMKQLGIYPCWPHAFPLNAPLWFLKALIPLAFLAPILGRIPEKPLCVLIIACLACSDIVVSVEKCARPAGYVADYLPNRTYESAMALGFFCGGILIRKLCSHEQFTTFVYRNAWWPIAASALLMCLVRVWGFIPPSRSSSLVVLSVLTVFSIAALCDKYFPSLFKRVASWGSAAFFVYATHWIVMKCMHSVAIPAILTETVWGRQLTCLPPLLNFTFCLMLFFVMRKHFPRLMNWIAMTKPARSKA